MERRSTRSERNESSEEKRISRPLDLTKLMTSMAVYTCQIASSAVGILSTHVLDVGHVLAVGVLPQVRGGANDDIDAVNTCLDGDSCVVHVAADVGENLGLSSRISFGGAVRRNSAV